MNFQIALVQFKPVRKHVQTNVKTIRRMLNGIQADLIVLPELSNCGYLYKTSDTLQPFSEPKDGSGVFLTALKDLSDKTGGIIISGYAENDQGQLFNSSAAVTPTGVINNYRKTHLYSDEKILFSPGDTGFNVFTWRNVNIGMMICFDWIFPEAARTLSLAGAQIIAHPSNLVLPYCQKAMVTRSIENKVFTITANRIGNERLEDQKISFTGKSQITNPCGEVLFFGPDNKATVHVIAIDPHKALNKNITTKNDLYLDRKPQLYNLE